MFSSSKCTLIMSDEGLQVYYAAANSARFIDFIPWETDGFEEVVSKLISRKAKKRPVIILNDMVEQHYRKEQVPKVNIMDRSNVLQRRLNIAFPNHKINSALKLKNSNGIEGGATGMPYLFAAMPNSSVFRATLSAVERSGAAIEGVYLLPVEASAAVKTMSVQLQKKDRERTMWTIFAGQHHNGGLRQVVIRNGELALTRMTPIVDTDVEPDMWAKEVSNELSATMSYLSRFGYKETDGLRIIIVSGEGAAPMITQLNGMRGKLNVLTAPEAASLLGVKLNAQAEARYADPVFVASLVKGNKFLLPMNSPLISSLTTPRRVASFVILALLAGTAYFGYQSFSSFAEYSKQKDRLEVAKQKKQAIQAEYDRELQVKKELGFDFALVNNALLSFEELKKQKMFPLPVIREIGRSLGPDLNLDNILLDVVSKEVTDSDNVRFDERGNEIKAIEYFMSGALNLSFPNEINPDLGVQAINILSDRLRNNLPSGFTVDITKQVADLSYTGNFVGGEFEGEQQEDYTAEIQIRGPLQ